MGEMDTEGRIVKGSEAPMKYRDSNDGKAVYIGAVPLTESGRHGFAVRAMPSHPDMFDRICPGLIHWS